MLTVPAWQDGRRINSSKTWCTCWRVTRTDGTILRFTDHSHPVLALTDHDLLQSVTDGNETFYPSGGFDASARQMRPALEAQNLKIVGFISSAKITHDDLFAGRYDEALIEEFTIDHRYPWLGPFKLVKYWVLDVEYDEVTWKATVVGVSRWLKAGAGRTCGPLCDADLGDSRCGITIGTTWEETSLVPNTIIDARQKITLNISNAKLKDTSLYAQWSVGKIECTTGANAGITLPIKTWENVLTSPDRGDLTTQLRWPFDMAMSDRFTVTIGCLKTKAACEDVFSNIINHRGFEDMPGMAEMLEAPA